MRNSGDCSNENAKDKGHTLAHRKLTDRHMDILMHRSMNVCVWGELEDEVRKS